MNRPHPTLQGGAVVDALLARSPGAWRIVALTRDATQPVAAALTARGVDVATGNCLSRASLDAVFAAVAPVHAVFLVTNPFAARWSGKSNGFTAQGEEAQGINMIDAAAAAGVKHLVFTSVASAGESEVDGKPVETFATKHRIEQHLIATAARSNGLLEYTIIAPVGFLENMTSAYAGLKQGVVPALLKPDHRTQMIACADVGIFARIVLEDVRTWAGKRLEIAGDNTSASAQAAILSRLRGGEPWKVSTPPEWVFSLFVPAAVGRLRLFLREKGTHVDVDACRRLHPGLMTFEQWALSQGMDTREFPRATSCEVM